jgi:acyl-CoA reductase-like NAD-dependent aldehyde dehydrogenase
MTDDELVDAVSDVIYPKLNDAWGRIFSDLSVEADEAAEAVLAAIQPAIEQRIKEARAEALREAEELLTDLQENSCVYGTRDGDGKPCDCKYGGLRPSSEVTGCAEYRQAARLVRGLAKAEEAGR